jgi:hypothetical protein
MEQSQLAIRKALQYLKNRKNMPEAKLYEEDSKVAVEREERQILAIERIATVIDVQAATIREVTANLCKVTG